MRISRLPWAIALLALLTVVSVSCQNAGTDKVLGVGSPQEQEVGVNLSADPEKITLDPNDPDAPRDPGTNKLIGQSVISAIVLDASLQPLVGVGVTFSATAGTLASAGQPVNTDENGRAQDTLAVTEDNAGEITVSATSGESTKSLVVPVELVPLNNAPVADAGDDQALECPGPVTLDGSGSSDADSTEGTNDDITSFEWFLGETKIADGQVAHVELPVGTHLITLKVTDKAGATSTDEVTVTIVDTTPPVVSLRMSPASLWPPNHKMRDVRAMLEIHDCDPAPKVELVSVTSNEPENGLGDGDTSPDISGAGLGADDRNVRVRAERAGGGSGRIYTFVYRVTDASGNATEATSTVTVPHDQGH